MAAITFNLDDEHGSRLISPASTAVLKDVLFCRLDLYPDIRYPIISIPPRFLNQAASPRKLIEVEGLAALVLQAALRAITIALRVSLQVGCVRKCLLAPPLNYRLAPVVGDARALDHGSDAARLKPQRIDRRFKEAMLVPGIIRVCLASVVLHAKAFATIE